jgi:hypothetical protein
MEDSISKNKREESNSTSQTPNTRFESTSQQGTEIKKSSSRWSQNSFSNEDQQFSPFVSAQQSATNPMNIEASNFPQYQQNLNMYQNSAVPSASQSQLQNNASFIHSGMNPGGINTGISNMAYNSTGMPMLNQFFPNNMNFAFTNPNINNITPYPNYGSNQSSQQTDRGIQNQSRISEERSITHKYQTQF